MNEIQLYLFIAIVAGFVLYMNIQKLTRNIDKTQAQNLSSNTHSLSVDEAIDTRKYQHFCDAIDIQIREIKQKGLYDGKLKNDELKDSFLESLSNLSKKLTFIQTMNLNTKNPQKWENEITELLERLTVIIDENLKDSEAINDEVRDNLKVAFENL
ncbi:hypothetical protein KDD93_05720 [Campylobacter sp. faydin G-24]|uniref:Thioester dehydrase family protein n=1 Tax=Campylobacter anatolicus TaxID=2829105 RepID=A0ABS5HII8_9BACT|nr:hypothetical protein [Campylobacter anatolicus]MBR8464070.1 hypothetical protein [Campylobacter anatolicus]